MSRASSAECHKAPEEGHGHRQLLQPGMLIRTGHRVQHCTINRSDNCIIMSKCVDHLATKLGTCNKSKWLFVESTLFSEQPHAASQAISWDSTEVLTGDADAQFRT